MGTERGQRTADEADAEGRSDIRMHTSSIHVCQRMSKQVLIAKNMKSARIYEQTDNEANCLDTR